MTPKQKQAVEKAKKEYYSQEYFNGKSIFEEVAERIITNPSDFGLVSKSEMFEFAYYLSIRNLADNDKTIGELFEIYKAKTEQK